MSIEIHYQTQNNYKKYIVPNKVSIENVIYEIDQSEPPKHGGNSFVLKAFKQYDASNEYAIKFMLNGKKTERQLIKRINDSYEDSNAFIKIFAEDEVQFSEYSYSTLENYRNDENATHNSIKKTCYVMSFARMNLREFMCENEINSNDIKYYLLQLANGLSDLHKLGVKHLDIKPDNLLYVKNNFIFADFGSATTKTACKASDCSKTWPIPEYIEPCIDIRNAKIDAKKTDIFGLGCIFYYLITRQFPIGYESNQLQKLQVDEKLTNIVEHMLAYNQTDRLVDGEALYTQIVEYIANPSQRKGYSYREKFVNSFNCIKNSFLTRHKEAK